MYSRTFTSIILDYVTQFWEAYPENRKFFRTHFSNAHENLGELVKYMDDELLNFLKYFHEKGYLDDTIVFFVADHGAHEFSIRFPLFPDNSRSIENSHPVLMNLVKNDIPKENLEFLRSNEQAFMSSHDFYSTLKTIANGEWSNSHKSRSYPYIAQVMPHDRD